MNGMINFEGYTSAVMEALSGLEIFKTVGMYDELPDGFETPAVFFEIESWEFADGANIGGKLSVRLSCNFYIVREFAAKEYNRKLRNASLAFTGWVHGRAFGTNCGAAQFVSAENGGWYKDEKALASHHVWCVNTEQVVGIGMDYFDSSNAPLLKELWLGLAPDIGAAHKDDYTLIAKSEEE